MAKKRYPLQALAQRELAAGWTLDKAIMRNSGMRRRKKQMPPYRPPKSGNLPPRGKRILREVYTASRHKYPGEIAANKARSARIAWSAVEKAGYHKVGKNWRLKQMPVDYRRWNVLIKSKRAPAYKQFDYVTTAVKREEADIAKRVYRAQGYRVRLQKARRQMPKYPYSWACAVCHERFSAQTRSEAMAHMSRHMARHNTRRIARQRKTVFHAKVGGLRLF